jgi:uncharacterized protein YyaL (SSP411 family)
MEQKPNFYVCENSACSVPLTDIDELIARLKGRHQAGRTT